MSKRTASVLFVVFIAVWAFVGIMGIRHDRSETQARQELTAILSESRRAIPPINNSIGEGVFLLPASTVSDYLIFMGPETPNPWMTVAQGMAALTLLLMFFGPVFVRQRG